VSIPETSADESAALLAAYDAQLRTDAETPSAVDVTRLGPLRLVTFRGGRGFVTYRDLGGADARAVGDLVAGALVHFRADTEITRVEWKTRGHDEAPGLHEALVGHGFVAEESESIMIGEAGRLAVDVPLPKGVALRRVTAEADVRAMSAMQDEGFGDPVSDERADAVVDRLARDDGMELWVAEVAGRIVCAGRLEPVAGTEFAGIWGGATLPEWRGRGIYRALTAERARSALRVGKRLIHSDSTEFSRPILERSGLVKVSTTTPYEWRR
jgi:ribosomal protein S18 acetylase RimI-like enzyme